MQLKLARVVLTAVLLGGAVLSFVLDWSPNHLLSPAWHPHAKFHAAQLLFFHAGVALTGTWLLWRKSREPHTAIAASAMMAASFWLPLFFITSVLPGSSVWPGGQETIPHLAGHAFYPNLAVASIFLFVIFGSWWLARCILPQEA
jgi:hypothetical protein